MDGRRTGSSWKVGPALRRVMVGAAVVPLAAAGALASGIASAGATGTTAASKLAVTTEPPSSPPQTANFTVSVSTESSSSDVLTTNTSSVTIELTASGSPSAHLECTGATTPATSKTEAATAGVATFTCKVTTTGTYKLHATDGSLTAATSTTIDVAAAPTTTTGTASKLAVTTEPPTSPPQTADFTVSVSTESSSSDVLTTNTSSVTIELTASGSPSVHLECTGATTPATSKTEAATAGVATFTCKVTATGTYKLDATDGSLTTATSTTIDVVAAPTTTTGTTSSTTSVYGTTPDATAAAEFTRAFPSTKGSCPTTHAAVLATTKEYQDALSSQFLAEDLTTGTLLTPTESLASVTATTLKKEGITTVYVVGGPLAVTTTVATAIEALTAYECGGTTKAAGTAKIAVHRISGETQYATAMEVAEYVGTAASKAFAGAYATTDTTGGTGKYNDTAGKGSAAPSGAEPTAILASGEEFQDAQAASVVSYRTKLPLLLTPATTLSTTAVAAITKLGVKQVVLMGGPLAVTDTVEAALVAKTGVSVLRVAGEDYTDTARELARFEAAGSTAGLGWTPGHRVMVARGNGFTDGLCGAVLESSHNATTGSATTARPLLLTENPTQIGTYLATFLKVTGHTGIDKTAGKTVTSLTVLGGPLAVSTAEISAMQTDLGH